MTDAISSASPATKSTTLTARTLLLRGMLVGIVAGLLVFAFARWIGEPQVERAIAFESSVDKAKGEAPEPEMVSRTVQRGLGLLTGVLVYGAAIGGIFGLVFALAYGRIGDLSPRALSALLAAISFVTIVLVPNLKYPANPPAVGNPETIGVRTAAFFLLIAFSIAAMVLAIQVRGRISPLYGTWNGFLLSGGLFIVVICVVSHFLPEIDEIPAGFPANLLWRFRVAALELQAVLWTAVGLLFGWLTERDTRLSHAGRP
ncbi:CbtA family protein [Tunturiibacter lichenicola]|uniref:CbtA family protein n=1 Tax=Tunturiibacter lichenicola TaxID=2051959 RepID=UPI0021B465D4|nr:CbtA family protein [Edaphobacter lichenicola]